MPESELRARVLTSIVLGGIVIGLILIGQMTASLLVLLICALSAYELYQITVARHEMEWAFVFSCVLSLPLILHHFFPVAPGSFGGTGVLLDWIAVLSIPVLFGIVLLASLRTSPGRLYARISALALGFVIITIPGFFALQLLALTPLFLLGIFLLIWASDISAYLIGSRWGRTKLAPVLSPGKSWEGTIGAFLVTVLVAFALSQWIDVFGWRDWVVNALLVVLFGTLGDLGVSAIKRSAQVKDTGTLLPGHGGFLDRFDSFLGCLPWIGLYNLFI